MVIEMLLPLKHESSLPSMSSVFSAITERALRSQQLPRMPCEMSLGSGVLVMHREIVEIDT